LSARCKRGAADLKIPNIGEKIHSPTKSGQNGSPIKYFLGDARLNRL
jgi:hypothetical protein